MKKYLIIEKEQRIQTEKKYTYVITRLLEEIEKEGSEGFVCFYKDIEILMIDDKLEILFDGRKIEEFTHVIFRGHSLHNPIEYETKQIITDYIEQKVADNPALNIQVQNGLTTNIIKHYDKLYITHLLIKNSIKVGSTYYRPSHTLIVEQGRISYPLIAKQYAGENDIRLVDGKEKVKKNVYLVKNREDFNQEYLKDKDLSEYLLQEFLPTSEDFRIFVSKGKAYAGFARRATEGFMTVNKGEYEAIDLNKHAQMVDYAQKTAKVLKADFIAVDFMYKEEVPVVIEISLNPGFKAFETKTSEEDNRMNVARLILDSFAN